MSGLQGQEQLTVVEAESMGGGRWVHLQRRVAGHTCRDPERNHQQWDRNITLGMQWGLVETPNGREIKVGWVILNRPLAEDNLKS